jgi:hypothetical protein
MTRTLKLPRNGAVGFIGWLDLHVAAKLADHPSVVSGGVSNVSRRVRIGVPLRSALIVGKGPAPQDS